MVRIPANSDTKFEVLASIVDHCSTATFGPTVEEIRKEVGLSVRSSVQWHINDLLEEGYVSHIPRKHRTLRPTDKGLRLVGLMREIDNGEAASEGEERVRDDG